MSRAELAIAIAGALLVTFAIGWLAHWLWSRALGLSSPRSDRADELAAELLIVETERDRIRNEAEEAAQTADAAIRERAAEIEALLDGLGEARAEIEELRRRG
ncbi:MAG: hypothetical protein ACK5MQ_05105 [Pikeienuella sp.]